MPNISIASIGTIDSSGGAGINQDIRIAALFDNQIHTCIANLSLQSSKGLLRIQPIDPDIFKENLQQFNDLKHLRYLKIGALHTMEQIDILQNFLNKTRNFKVILDPVIRPSSGKSFLEPLAAEQLLKLVSKNDFLCPNINELSILTKQKIRSFSTALKIARELAIEKGITILLKGGHLKTKNIKEACISPEHIMQFSHPRKSWTYSHGTGCALAMAFCSFLTLGMSDSLAFKNASLWVLNFYDKINSSLNQSSIDI